MNNTNTSIQHEGSSFKVGLHDFLYRLTLDNWVKSEFSIGELQGGLTKQLKIARDSGNDVDKSRLLLIRSQLKSAQEKIDRKNTKQKPRRSHE